jgi:protease-4
MSPDPVAPAPSAPFPAPLPAAPSAGPIRVVVEQPPRRFGRLGYRLLWAALIISVLVNVSFWGAEQSYYQTGGEVNEKYHSLSRTAHDKVAIITIEGTILGDTYVKKQIDRVRDDEHVKAIVLRVDSPGGTVTGSDYIYHHLKKLAADKQIPVVVSMGSIAASGGYYVSMAAGDKDQNIFAEPTTWTGSIGVIIPHYDLSGLLARWDVADDSIASASMKQMGSPTRKLPEKERAEEREILKNLVDESFASFKQIVLKSRPALREHADWQAVVFSGRIFTATQAQKNGLIDKLGFVEDAIDRAIELAHLDKKDVRVVKYPKPTFGLISLLTADDRARRFDLSALLDMTAPRAFYLCTLLPGVSLGPRQ